MRVVAGAGRARRSDQLEDFIERMQPEVLAYCRRRLGTDRGDEVYSDVMLAAFQASQQGKEVTPSWYMTVARNKVVDHWRRVEREGRLVERLQHESRPFHVDDVELVDGEVAASLRELRPRYRSVLVRHYLRGEPVGDIAKADGVSYGAAESAMARARAAFRHAHAGAN